MKIDSEQIALRGQIKLETRKAPSKKVDDAADSPDQQLVKKSKELESVFLSQLIKSMEKTIPEGMGGGKSTLSTMMFSSVMGDAMAEGGGIGLSRIIYESLKTRGDLSELPEIPGEDYLETMRSLQAASFSGGSK